MDVTTIYEWLDNDCTSTSAKVFVIYFYSTTPNVTAKSLIQNPDNQKPDTNTVYLTDSNNYNKIINNTFIKNKDGSLNSSIFITNLVTDEQPPLFTCNYSNVTINPDKSKTVSISGTCNFFKTSIITTLPYTQVNIKNNSSTQTTFYFFDGTTSMGQIIFDYYPTDSSNFNSIHCSAADIFHTSLQMLIFTNMAIAYYQNSLNLGITPDISPETFSAMYGVSVEPISQFLTR